MPGCLVVQEMLTANGAVTQKKKGLPSPGCPDVLAGHILIVVRNRRWVITIIRRYKWRGIVLRGIRYRMTFR